MARTAAKVIVGVVVVILLFWYAFTHGVHAAPVEPPPFAPGQYVVTGARVNARASASTSAKIVTVLLHGDLVTATERVEGTRVAGSVYWYHVTLPDGATTAYVHSSLLTPYVAPAVNPVDTTGGLISTPPPTAIPISGGSSGGSGGSAPASFTCPRNCAGAVAMGLSPQQAATCPGLDRDHDGVACYGD